MRTLTVTVSPVSFVANLFLLLWCFLILHRQLMLRGCLTLHLGRTTESQLRAFVGWLCPDTRCRHRILFRIGERAASDDLIGALITFFTRRFLITAGIVGEIGGCPFVDVAR